MPKHTLWLLAAVYVMFTTLVSPQTAPPVGASEKEIERLEEQARQAALKADTTFIEKYTAADYVAITANGRVHGKQAEIQNWQSGLFTYQAIEVHELKIRIYGDTAICSSLASVRGTNQGRTFSQDNRFTRVWVKQAGDWKVVMFQSTRADQ